jgi:hypothetical protein
MVGRVALPEAGYSFPSLFKTLLDFFDCLAYPLKEIALAEDNSKALFIDEIEYWSAFPQRSFFAKQPILDAKNRMAEPTGIWKCVCPLQPPKLLNGLLSANGDNGFKQVLGET